MTRLTSVASGDTITATIENADRAGINKTMQLMTPTSVSTGTIGTYGAVTFTAASSVSLNGVFTSEFDWYEIVFDVATNGSATMGATLRVAGADAVTNYDTQRIALADTVATASQSLAAASWLLTGRTITGRHSGRATLWGPAIAAQTTGQVLAGSSANPMTTTLGGAFWGFLSHRTLTAYDGITVTPSTGTITGAIRVYGII